MDRKISDFIGENAVLKNEVAELKKSLQFDSDQWEGNFKTLHNLKNELLQNQKHYQQQQQPVIPDLKEIKDKVNDLENRSRRNNLGNDGIIKEGSELWVQSEKKLHEIIKDQLQFERDIEIERAHRIGKTMIDGSPNKRRTIIAKFVNFMDKQEVLSEYKARKSWNKCIFFMKLFLKILWRSAKVSSKELRSYGKKESLPR